DLDILGVLISYRHAWQPHWAERAPVTIVTAFVDGVCVHTPIIPANRDLRLSGFVSWVGSSSIEVTMKIEQQAGEDGAAGVAWTPVLDATFVNAARHPLENRAAKLNPLLLESAADREIFQRGERAKAYRLQQASQSVLSVVPRNEEIAKIHRMFLDTIDPKSFTFSRRRLPAGSVWLRDTMLKTAHLYHPEQMNVYCKVFGGFLMRKALETAWICAFAHCRRQPVLLEVKDVSFRAPVELGSLLFLSAQVTCSHGCRCVVRVHAEVLQPDSGLRTTTNDFYFVFAPEAAAQAGEDCVPDAPQREPSASALMAQNTLLPPKFSGTDGTDVRKWLRIFEEFANDAKWDDATSASKVKLLLTGEAQLVVWDLAETRQKSFKSIKEDLTKFYGGEADSFKAMSDFYAKETWRCRDTAPEDSIAQRDRDVRFKLLQLLKADIRDNLLKAEDAETCSLETLLQRAARLEELAGRQSVAAVGAVSATSSAEPSEDRLDRLEKRMEELIARVSVQSGTDTRRRRQQRGGGCFNCGQLGHRAAQCQQREKQPGPIICHKCSGRGHKASANGKPCRWLLDTGAQTSLISDVALRELDGRCELKPADVRPVSVDGSVLELLGSVSITVRLSHQLRRQMDVLVVRGIRPNFILGMDFVSKAARSQFSIDQGAKTVAFDGEAVPFSNCDSKQDGPLSCCLVPTVIIARVQGAVVVPPRSVKVVDVTTETKQAHGIFEPSQEFIDRIGVLPGRVFAVSSESGKIPVQVCNLSCSPVTLFSNQSIGTFESAEVIDEDEDVHEWRGPADQFNINPELPEEDSNRLAMLLRAFADVVSVHEFDVVQLLPMNPTRGMHSRLQQQQQQQEARERTHEPICVKETRVCWIEFGASLTCLSVGIIFVFAGVSADSSAVGSSGGSQATKPAGILAVTYLGVALLIIGGALLIVFGIHFYRVKSGLDAAKAERFAQLGIQPSSRYQELPSQSATAAAFGSRPRPPVLPLPSRDPVQQQQRRVPQEQRPQPSQMSSSRLQPMPSYREGAFYNLGFLSDEAEAARSPAQPQVATISTGRAPSQQPSPLNNKLSPYAQHGAQPPADRTRQGPAGQYNLPPPGDQVRRGPSAQFDPRPTTDQARNASSAQYGVQQRDDHPRRSQQAVQAHQDVPTTASFVKHAPPSGPPFEEAPVRIDRAKRAGFASAAAANFSTGFSDAPPAGAVGGVQSSRSYHSGFSGGATRKQISASASGQDFQAKATVDDSARQGRPYGESRHLPSWQQPPIETPPPQRLRVHPVHNYS
uniref:CCHC-type domain-containing protein n=1 Tax=Macrostomum lignano TaxID=282301 RepID=A0A1I8GB59_9PLAT